MDRRSDGHRYVVYGAGAIGSALGAWLHLAGHEALLVGRPAHVHRILILAPLNRLRDLRDDLTGRAVARDSVDRHAPRPSVLGSASRPWHVIFSRGQFTAGAALEVVGPQTNKATGVRALADYLGIEMGQIAVLLRMASEGGSAASQTAN